MYSAEYSQRCPSARGRTPGVRCRSVVILYTMLCLASLLEAVEPKNLRCGTELIDTMRFVCGDRGFYIGKASRFRAHHRARPPTDRVVDQCCEKSCSLSYLETFCAKPKRSATPTPPQQVVEQQFQTVFHRRLVKYRETARGAKRQTDRGPNQGQKTEPSLWSTEPLTSSPPTVSTSPLPLITQL